MATQDYTPAAIDAQYPAYTGFTTQDPRAVTLSEAQALKPLIYGVQFNQMMCELLKHQELLAAFIGFPWVETADDAYVVSSSFNSGTRFYVTPATATTPSVTLPAASLLAPGTSLTLVPGPTYTPNIYADAADTFYFVSVTGQTMTLYPYNAVSLVTDGVDKWVVTAGVPTSIF